MEEDGKDEVPETSVTATSTESLHISGQVGLTTSGVTIYTMADLKILGITPVVSDQARNNGLVGIEGELENTRKGLENLDVHDCPPPDHERPCTCVNGTELPTDEYMDAVIINADSEREEATRIQQFMSSIELDNKHKPKVSLFEDMLPYAMNEVEKPDSILEKTSLVLALITPTFIKSKYEKQTAFSAFLDCIYNEDEKKDCFIPLYTVNHREPSSKWIPSLIRSYKGFRVDGQWMETRRQNMKKTLEYHLPKRLQKERENQMKMKSSCERCSSKMYHPGVEETQRHVVELSKDQTDGSDALIVTTKAHIPGENQLDHSMSSNKNDFTSQPSDKISCNIKCGSPVASKKKGGERAIETIQPLNAA